MQEIGHSEQQAVGLHAFLAGIDQPQVSENTQQFDAAHFKATGRTSGRNRVVIHHLMQTRIGLSRIDVLVQLSDAYPARDFALTD